MNFSGLTDQKRSKNILITPIVFQKIKNYIISDYSVAEYGRFAYYLSTDQERFWKQIGEKYPIPRALELRPADKANVIWERLAQEPSPRRFVELCQAVADHMKYISNLPYTECNSPNHFDSESYSIFLWEIREAYYYHKLGYAIKSTHSKSNPQMIGRLRYVGNDFGQDESEKFILNTFNAPTVSSALLLANKHNDNKRLRWSLSKIAIKLKPPFIEIGAEVNKK